MSDSLYFNLLFHKLSDSSGNISLEILQLLANSYSEISSAKIESLYNDWKQNQQIWCFKPNIGNDKPLINVITNVNKSAHQKSDEVGRSLPAGAPLLDPVMVIHVCDEPKNLNRDFHCPRTLLVNEMKYFSEYLSGETQNIEDVDISVHCDVNIFEWLIKYARRNQLAVNDRVSVAALKPNNVISILISSDFLKMDTLVDECLTFICDNMNNLLECSNINCINSSLVSRLTHRLTDLEITNVVDRKDKIKSTLFKCKIECLFDPQLARKSFTIAAATHLFKCKYCEKILIRNYEVHIKCVDSRLCVDFGGSLIFNHEPNEEWLIEEQFSEWVQHFRTGNQSMSDATSMVYWRLWSHLNMGFCEKCNEAFPLYEIGHCRFHTDTPRYGKDDGRSVIPITEGMYLCCGMKSLRFDPFQVNKGCKARDHMVKLYTNGIKYNDEIGHLNKITDVLNNHRNLFEIPFSKELCVNDFVSNVIGRDRLISRSKLSETLMKDCEDIDVDIVGEHAVRPKLQPLIRLSGLKKLKRMNNALSAVDDIEEDIGESDIADRDDVTSDNSDYKDSPITIKAGAILLGAPQFPVFKNKKWDSTKSMRYNQDSQRQEDLRRMRQIVQYLTSLRVEIDKNPKQKLKEFSGGIYCQVEQQWRNEVMEKIAINNVVTQRVLSLTKMKQKPSPGTQPFK